MSDRAVATLRESEAGRRRPLRHARARMARMLGLCVYVSVCGRCLAFNTPEPSRLVDEQRCMFCHTVDTPFRAPSFQQIADRYRDVPGAGDMLERKLRQGGEAHWGKKPMPSAAGRGGGPLSREDAHELVQWVLSH
ncbi:c-type cytochrome (plasmid) [Caballeronia sp. NK8]|nr:c-type cytochrome [Caballeronia sp. NK8]